MDEEGLTEGWPWPRKDSQRGGHGRGRTHRGVAMAGEGLMEVMAAERVGEVVAIWTLYHQCR